MKPSRQLIRLILLFSLLLSLPALAIQGRHTPCPGLIQPVDEQTQALANLTCQSEIESAKCDKFFEDEEQRKEFARSCPPTQRDRQLNGYDLGLICAQQMIQPTVDGIKSLARFFAAGMKEAQENRAKFIHQCEEDPQFKATTAGVIPIFSNTSAEDIRKIPCSYLAVEVEEWAQKQKEFHANENAEANYLRYIRSAKVNEPLLDTENPVQTLIKYNREKWPCLNQAGHYQLVCYELFSVLDPLLAASAAPKAARLLSLFSKVQGATGAAAKAVGPAARTAEVAEISRAGAATQITKAAQNPALRFESGMGQKLDKALNEHPPTPLAEGIKNSGLDRKFLENIQSRSRGAISFRDFLNQPATEGTTALGISKPEIYRAIVDEKGLEHWNHAYDRFGIKTNEYHHTQKFMDAITSGDRKVVIFVPNEVLTYKIDSVTRAEIQWLQAHPDRLSNVQFVFGAYDHTPYSVEQAFYELHLNDRRRVEVLRRFLQEVSNGGER